MKTLLIIRHAKSDWENGELHDIERPLADRGLRDAKLMGAVLAGKQIKPDLMISSPALRAFSTCRIIADNLGYDKNLIRVDQQLYFGEIADIISMLNEISPDIKTVCIFGHNPTFTLLSHTLCSNFGTEMPTCGVVALEFNTNDKSISKPETGKFLWFDFPKNNS